MTSVEIVTQVEQVARDYPGVSNLGVTFAGMGEPLLNYDNVVGAARMISALSYVDHVTISTVGVVPRIYELSRDPGRFDLWVSVHASNDDLRQSLIPYARRYPLDDVVKAASAYARHVECKVGASYLLLPGYNAAREDAEAMAALLDPDLFNVQLLLWNTVEGMPFERVPRNDAEEFASWLRELGQPAYVMESAAREIDGGCGQLVTQVKLPRARGVAGNRR